LNNKNKLKNSSFSNSKHVALATAGFTAALDNYFPIEKRDAPFKNHDFHTLKHHFPVKKRDFP
jgi:hypothetical protein